jgi:hypothetical protein
VADGLENTSRRLSPRLRMRDKLRARWNFWTNVILIYTGSTDLTAGRACRLTGAMRPRLPSIQSRPVERGRSAIRRGNVASITLVVILVFTAIAVFSSAMRSFDHNEGLYVTAGWLVAHGHELYADFSFWQMPYSALLYGTIYRALDPMHLLLAAKITAYVFWLIAVAFASGIAWVHTGCRLCVLVAAVLFGLNPTVIRCAAEASNYIQPIAFSLGAYWFAQTAWSRAGRPVYGWLGAGLCTGIAIGFKLYYLPTAAVYLLVLLTVPRAVSFAQRIRTGVLPFVAGCFIGLIPVLILASAHWEVFWFNNLRVHGLTTTWWKEIVAVRSSMQMPSNVPLGWFDKLSFALGIMRVPGNFVLVLGIGVSAAVLVFTRRVRGWLIHPENLLASGLAAVSFGTVFAPTPMWTQYWGFPIPYLFIWFCNLVRGETREPTGKYFTVLMVAAIITLTAHGRTIARDVRLVGRTEWWPGLIMPREARRLAAATNVTEGPAGLVALQQIWAVESGRFAPIPELAYAPFTYVIAPQLTPQQRSSYRIIGPNDIAAFLQNSNPAALVAGLYANGWWSDHDLITWAEGHAWIELPLHQSYRAFVPGASSARTDGSPARF